MSLMYSEQVGGRRHGLYLGGKADAKSRDKLDRWGVTHILNVTRPKEGSIQAGVPNYFESKYKYKRIAVYDASTSDLLQHADSIVAFISSGLCHGSVLVHCQRGVSRSATSVAFYLMRKAGMNLKDSMALIRQKRPEAEPIPAFMTQLREYEKRCIDLGVISSKQKTDHSESSKSTKKRAIGPAMGPLPSKRVMIGPSLPPGEGQGAESAPPKKDDNATICGPQLPSTGGVSTRGTGDDRTERKEAGEAVDEGHNKTNETGKSKSSVVLGPTTPENLDKQGEVT